MISFVCWRRVLTHVASERAWAGTRSHEASVDDFERIYNAAQQRPAPPLPDAPATWAEEFDKSVADAWADEFAEREKERQATNDGTYT